MISGVTVSVCGVSCGSSQNLLISGSVPQLVIRDYANQYLSLFSEFPTSRYCLKAAVTSQLLPGHL